MITRTQREINKGKKRRLLKSDFMYCKFSDTKDYVNETSIAQRNEVLGLELSSLMLLLFHSLSLKNPIGQS